MCRVTAPIIGDARQRLPAMRPWLPILALEPDLDRYYYDNVIGGPGAFVIPARDYETFADAVLKKLITEIAANTR